MIEEQQTALELARRKAEAERKAREREEKEAGQRQQKMAESAARKITAQRERESLAEKVFGQIVLDPSIGIQLSNTLKKEHSASVELRGKGYDTISELHKNKDWLALINEISEQSYTELPDADSIKRAASALEDKRFQMLIKTKSVFDDGYNGPVILYITFPLSYPYEAVHLVERGWESHPDAIGYFNRWSPSDGCAIVVYDKRNIVRNYIGQLNERFRTKRSEVTSRVELGEIDKLSASLDLAAERSQLHDEAVSWAKGQ